MATSDLTSVQIAQLRDDMAMRIVCALLIARYSGMVDVDNLRSAELAQMGRIAYRFADKLLIER